MRGKKPILFIDFDGTICFDRFWRSLPKEQYTEVQKILFEGDRQRIHDWMLGKYTSEEINQYVSLKLGISYSNLWESFVRDCSTMEVSKEVLSVIKALSNRYTTLLITGNMDCFSRFTVPSLQLDKYFDHISNSYYEKTNKTDNQGALFLEYIKKYSTSIKDSIVIDDSETVCTIFDKLGGTAYRVTSKSDVKSHLLALVETH